MGEALEAAWIGSIEPDDQHFPAPDAAVGAVAGAVEREADDRTLQRMLRHAGRDVRVVMLHGDERQIVLGGPFLCPRRGQIAGMQIVHHGLRLDLEGVHQVLQRFAEEVEAGEVFEIAQVLALVSKSAASESEDIFQVPAHGEQRRRIEGQRHGKRHKPARAADQLRRAIDHGHHRIVAALQNLAVVHQEGIGNVPEPRKASSLSIAMGSSLRLALVITRARTRASAKSRCCNGA